MQYPVSPRENWIEVNTATGPIGNNPGTVIPPHFTIPSYGPGGHLVQGFSFAIMNPGVGVASGDGGAYDCSLWRLLPTASQWVYWTEIPGVELSEEFITYDIGAGASFYVQITNITVDGILLFAVTPLI